MNSKTKLIIFIILCISATNCSTGPYNPESYGDKVARFHANKKALNNPPDFVISKKLFQKSLARSSRSPASINSNSLNLQNKYSNKHLYFITLFKQYNSLKNLSVNLKSEKISSCPHFHNAFSEQKNIVSSPYSWIEVNQQIKYLKMDDIKNEAFMATHPEFSLPLSIDYNTPKVSDYIIQNKSLQNTKKISNILQKAVDIHVMKTKKELDFLCTTGKSDNYYKFENLITHIKQAGSLPKETKTIETMLKIPVFSNVLISKRFSNKSSNQMAATTTELFNRSRFKWALQYFDDLKTYKRPLEDSAAR